MLKKTLLSPIMPPMLIPTQQERIYFEKIYISGELTPNKCFSSEVYLHKAPLSLSLLSVCLYLSIFLTPTVLINFRVSTSPPTAPSDLRLWSKTKLSDTRGSSSGIVIIPGNIWICEFSQPALGLLPAVPFFGCCANSSKGRRAGREGRYSNCT